MSNRREFLGRVVSVAAASMAAGTGIRAQAQTGQKLTESDPTAKALGFRLDAAKVDKTKFPKYAPGQTCSGCQLYQGKPTDAEAPCATFGGKIVPAKGWCSAWVKRA